MPFCAAAARDLSWISWIGTVGVGKETNKKKVTCGYIWEHAGPKITEDWFSVWLGFLTIIAIIVIVVLTYDKRALVPFIPQLWEWKKPSAAFYFKDSINVMNNDVWIGILLNSAVMAIVNVFSGVWIHNRKVIDLMLSYTCVHLVGFLALFLGKQGDLSKYGLGYAFWAIVFGIVIVNVTDALKIPNQWLLKPNRPEYFLKIGLVLLAIKVQTVINLGAPGIIVAFVVTPIVLVSMYLFGVKVLKMANKKLVMTITTGTSVCGASAAAAASASCGGNAEDLAIAIGVISFFTTILMVSLPYLVIYAGIDEIVAGAWFGGSINETAAVVAAGAIVSAICEEVASVVKMVQNAIIGFVCLGIAFYWYNFEETGEGGKVSYWVLWKKFPKFVLGFFIASLVYSFVLTPTIGDAKTDLILDFAKAASTWWFCVAFVGIGLSCSVKVLIKKLKGGKLLLLYGVGQTFNMLLTLAAAYFSFSGAIFAQPDVKDN